MMITRRIYISGPRDEWLAERRQRIKHRIIDEIGRAGYEPQYFDVPSSGGLVAGKVWNFDTAAAVMRRCVGTAILGLARWTFTQDQRRILLPSEYCHYEGSLAHAFGLPILAVIESDSEARGIFVPYGLPIVRVPKQADSGWVDTKDFKQFVGIWKERLEARRDLFLGYCSSSHATAGLIKSYLQRISPPRAASSPRSRRRLDAAARGYSCSRKTIGSTETPNRRRRATMWSSKRATSRTPRERSVYSSFVRRVRRCRPISVATSTRSWKTGAIWERSNR